MISDDVEKNDDKLELESSPSCVQRLSNQTVLAITNTSVEGPRGPIPRKCKCKNRAEERESPIVWRMPPIHGVFYALYDMSVHYKLRENSTVEDNSFPI